MKKLITLAVVALATLFLVGCQSNETVISEQQQATQSPAIETNQVTQQTQVKQELTLTQAITQSLPQKTNIQPVKTKDKATDKAAGSALKGITIKSDGFAPSSITVVPGTKVIFINVDDTLHWPASAIHPTHEVCPGFDSKKPLAKNETYAFTFTESKTCPFHDHLNPLLRGSIIVK